jgi:ATP-dependent protease ClpP protease subunit
MKKTINIFGDISSDTYWDDCISAKMINDELSGLTATDEIEININSYGGEVFEAVAIASLISNCPSNRVFNILGICASAATMLFDPKDKVFIHNGAMVMYHKPSTFMFGNSNDMRKTAALMDKMENETIIKNLSIRTGKTSDELTALITNEWWLTSDEAISELGFFAVDGKAIENKGKTKMTNIYKNYIERKKALTNSAFNRYINFKNSLK